MTKENFTSINVIIDRSGSMASLTNETVTGYNTFVNDQKALPGDAMFTLCLFNTRFSIPYDCVKLADIPALTAEVYAPGGYTALLDAVGNTINQVGAKLNAMPEEERPSKVIFLIITDGEENASREYSADQIQSMISHQKDKYNWEFVFMGANIDAVKAGTSLGVSARNSVTYGANSIGTKNLYADITKGVSSYRRSKSSGPIDFFNQPDPVIDPVVDPVVDSVVDPVVPDSSNNS